jgi:hypothetical protein
MGSNHITRVLAIPRISYNEHLEKGHLSSGGKLPPNSISGCRTSSLGTVSRTRKENARSYIIQNSMAFHFSQCGTRKPVARIECNLLVIRSQFEKIVLTPK